MAEVRMTLLLPENEGKNRPLRSVPEYDLVVALHKMNTNRADVWGFEGYPNVSGMYGRDWIRREIKYKQLEHDFPSAFGFGLTIEVV